LIEWDHDIPSFSRLAAEAARAQLILDAETLRETRRLAA
jgi:uncharacterized protein (UPF0276 family)